MTRSQLLARRRERGLISTSPAALVSAGAVLLAVALYFVTTPEDQVKVSVDAVASEGNEPVAPEDRVPTDVTPEPEPPASDVPTTSPFTPALPAAAVDRAATAVVVLNDTRIKGLAARTAVTLESLGWDVQHTANWVGVSQGSPVVFYPAGQADAAAALAADLKVTRVEPMPATMPEARVTVVLTGE